MKKRWIVGFAVLAVVVAGLWIGCSKAGREWYSEMQIRHGVSHALEISVKEGTLLSQKDSHGGFHGDGESCTVFQFPDDRFAQKIAVSGDWQQFPVDAVTEVLIYGKETEASDGTLAKEGPYFKEVVGPVENGWYRVIDRHSGAKEGQNAIEILQRGSFNVMVALYDADTDTLYVYQLDT